MAVEQDWSAYTDANNFGINDTFLLRTAAGAGVEVPASSPFRRLRAGNADPGDDSPFGVASTTTNLLARFGHLGAGVSPFVRFQGMNNAGTSARYADFLLDGEAFTFNILAPSTSGPSIRAISIDATGNTNFAGDISRSGTKLLGTRNTGWSTFSGTGTKGGFSTSTVTLSQLAQVVKALQDALTTHGIVGA